MKAELANFITIWCQGRPIKGTKKKNLGKNKKMSKKYLENKYYSDTVVGMFMITSEVKIQNYLFNTAKHERVTDK